MPVAQILAFVEEKDLSLKSMQPSDLEEIYPKANNLSSEDNAFYEKAKYISNELNLNNKIYKSQWGMLYELSVNEIKKLLKKLEHNFDYFYGESDVVKESEIVLKTPLMRA